jgi:hypothetical protein
MRTTTTSARTFTRGLRERARLTDLREFDTWYIQQSSPTKAMSLAIRIPLKELSMKQERVR